MSVRTGCPCCNLAAHALVITEGPSFGSTVHDRVSWHDDDFMFKSIE